MTIHERVRQAGDEKAREAAHKPIGEEATTQRDKDRDAMYAKALDPRSDWPEPALQGDHLKKVMDTWLPSPPTSPGGSGGSKTRKKGAAGGSPSGGQAASKRLPAAGVRGGVEARDEPNDVNQDVGEFLSQTISPHGHKSTARGVGAGYGELSQGAD